MAFSVFAKCDVTAPTSATPPPPPAVKFYPGIYTKAMAFMMNNTYFPATFTDADTTSVYGQLNRNTWFRGVLWPVDWGAIETSQGVYDWTGLDNICDVVGDPASPKNIYNISGRASAQNKKVLFLVNTKVFASTAAAVDDLIPGYLQATGTAYPNGMTRYSRLIGYESIQPQTGHLTTGYHLRWQYFRNGLTGNDAAGSDIYTLRDRFQAFLSALNNRYKDHPAFAGIVMTEPIPVGVDDILDIKYGVAGPDFNRDQFFAGRLQWLKNIKQIFLTQPVIEMPTFDNTYMQDMTNNGAVDGCVSNRIGIGGPNFHNGTNLQSIINARDFAANKVVICNQCQGLDMDTKTGYYTRPNTTGNPAPNDVWNFPTSPNTKLENPNFNAAGQLITQDPPDFDFIVSKAIHLKTNIFIYQYDVNNQSSRPTIGGTYGNRYNWNDFTADMNGAKGTAYISPNTGGPIKNDPAGGMVTTVPQFFV